MQFLNGSFLSIFPQSKEQAQNSPGVKVYRTLSQGPRARKSQSGVPASGEKGVVAGQYTTGQYQSRPYSVAYKPSDGSEYDNKDGFVFTYSFIYLGHVHTNPFSFRSVLLLKTELFFLPVHTAPCSHLLSKTHLIVSFRKQD